MRIIETSYQSVVRASLLALIAADPAAFSDALNISQGPLSAIIVLNASAEVVLTNTGEFIYIAS